MRSVVRSRLFAQASIFASSAVLVSVLGMVSTLVLARRLGPDDFGRFSFAVAFVVFVSMFFEFGFFLPAARMTASAEEGEKRRVIGAAVLTYIPIGFAFSLAILGLSFVVDSVFHADVGDSLRIMAPFAFGYPFITDVAERLAQGADRLHVSSITRVCGQAVFVLLLIVAIAVPSSLTVTIALVLRAIAVLIAASVFVVWIGPVFRGARRYIPIFLHHARSYGFAAYYGRVFSVGTFNMDTLMLAAFSNPRAVGFYTLAGSIAYASGLPILGLATALFPRMTKEARLSGRWIALAWTVGGAAALAAWLLTPLFIRVVFSPSYEDVYPLVLPLALAQMVRGVTSVYNSFFGAHGKGRELRNTSIILTVSNVALNFALIPPFAALGAAWASFFALLLNLAGYLVYYRRAFPAHEQAALA